MNVSLITVRYAKALFAVAKENNILAELKNDMELVLNVSRDSSEFNRMLNSPVVVPSEKINVLKAIFDAKVTATTINFLELTVKNNRESLIREICRDVVEMIKKENNIKTAVITTARELDKSTLNKAGETLEKELNAKVELGARTNEKIIGGLILRIDNMQYDASVETRLNRLKKEFLKTQL